MYCSKALSPSLERGWGEGELLVLVVVRFSRVGWKAKLGRAAIREQPFLTPNPIHP